MDAVLEVESVLVSSTSVHQPNTKGEAKVNTSLNDKRDTYRVRPRVYGSSSCKQIRLNPEHEQDVKSIQESVRGPLPNNIPTFSMIARLALARFAKEMRKASAYEREQIWREMVQGCMVPKMK